MDKAILSEILLAMAATMFGLLVAVLSWLGKKLYERLERLNKTLVDLEHKLVNRIHEIDKKVTKVETAHSEFKIVNFKRTS